MNLKNAEALIMPSAIEGAEEKERKRKQGRKISVARLVQFTIVRVIAIL